MFGTRRKTATVIAVVAVASSVLVPASPVTAADHGYLHDGYARLHHAKGFHNARGPVSYHRDYDSHHAGMDEEFHLVLRGVKKLAGKQMRVFVHGDLVGRVRVNDDGQRPAPSSRRPRRRTRWVGRSGPHQVRETGGLLEFRRAHG